MATADEHIKELLKLPIEDRAHAAKRLLDSLDDEPPQSDYERIKAAELDRRAQAIAAGQAKLVDMDEVRRRLAVRRREIRGE